MLPLRSGTNRPTLSEPILPIQTSPFLSVPTPAGTVRSFPTSPFLDCLAYPLHPRTTRTLRYSPNHPTSCRSIPTRTCLVRPSSCLNIPFHPFTTHYCLSLPHRSKPIQAITACSFLTTPTRTNHYTPLPNLPLRSSSLLSDPLPTTSCRSVLSAPLQSTLPCPLLPLPSLPHRSTRHQHSPDPSSTAVPSHHRPIPSDPSPAYPVLSCPILSIPLLPLQSRPLQSSPHLSYSCRSGWAPKGPTLLRGRYLGSAGSFLSMSSRRSLSSSMSMVSRHQLLS